MRLVFLEEMRMALEYFVMEKKPVVKDLLLNPLGKGIHVHDLYA